MRKLAKLMKKKKHDRGLTAEQVIASRERHGNNVLTAPEQTPLWRQFLEKFNDPLIKILLVALLLSVGLSVYEYHWLDMGLSIFFEPLGIFIAIVLATLVGFLVEVNANKKFRLLNQTDDHVGVKVVRDGHQQTVKAEELAPSLSLKFNQESGKIEDPSSSNDGKAFKKVLLAAADTFRAAAIDQLQIWAERSKCDIIKQGEGSDPAAVVYDAISAAKARGADIIIADTAGRLHNKKHLMDELAKINRIIDRELPDADKEILLVLDATTGQNAVSQVEHFKEATGITGIVLTKLDGTAKGGIVLAIKNTLDVPVKFIGVGEQIDDLQTFDPDQFSKALFDFSQE